MIGSKLCLTVLAGTVAIVAATPVLQLEERAGCTFTTAAAAIAGKKSCSTITLANINVPAGKTLDLTDLNQGTHVTFSGTTTFGYEEWLGPMIAISGTDITVTGTPGHVIDGQGARWWDGRGGNGGKTKPKFFQAHSLTTSQLIGLNIKDTPVQTFSINGAQKVLLHAINIDNSAGDELGHNTDAFDVSASNGVTISNANVKNQDDCVAINSGCDIVFTNGTCSGGHGLSVGSVGNNAKVCNVLFAESTVMNSVNGVRIKTKQNQQGSVDRVAFKNIKIQNISGYGIVVEQDYNNGGPSGHPTTGIPITNLVVTGVNGNVAEGAVPVQIVCGSKKSCANWQWGTNNIQGGKAGSKPSMNVPEGVSL